MPYIPPDAVFDPGTVLGDAKTIETRGVYIQVDAQGYPEDEDLAPGVACWIEYIGGVPYARSYPSYSPTASEVLHNPFGIVLRVYARANKHQLNQNEHTVVVAVTGTVGLKFAATDTTKIPGLGDRVSPYGSSIIKETHPGMPSLGICDGTCEYVDKAGNRGTVIAVRLDPQGDATNVGYSIPLTTTCIADEAIEKFAWVYASPEQPTAKVGGLLHVTKTGASNKHVVGITLDEATAPNKQITVQYYGMVYVPYKFPEHNEKFAALKAANGGKLPATFRNRIVRNDGSVGAVLTTILTVGSLIGTAVEVGGNIYRMIKGGSSPAKCYDDIRANRDVAKFQQLLAAENGVFEEQPDGYQGLFVSTSLMGPATQTDAPVLLDEPERDKNGNALIREGYIYAGSSAGVTKITPQNVNATSFYGVSAPSNTEDPEVNPPVPPNDSTQRIRVIRDGIANVVAVGNWEQGAYIDYLGKQIPADDEEFVPHIGKAMEATDSGKLGPVDIRPFNPNQYIIVDHCKLIPQLGGDFPTGTSVYVTVAMASDVVKSNIRVAEESLTHAYTSVAGVLVRFDENFYGQGDYNGRAVIQISGYVRCNIPSVVTPTAGMLITHMFNGVAQPVVDDDPTEAKYMNILGTVMWTEAIDGTHKWWIVLAPRTQYVAPLESSKKV